jgi:hypothetical protein
MVRKRVVSKGRDIHKLIMIAVFLVLLAFVIFSYLFSVSFGSLQSRTSTGDPGIYEVQPIPDNCQIECGNTVEGQEEGACDKRTHVCCSGGLCCPGHSVSANCKQTGHVKHCAVTKEMCDRIKTEDGRSYKYCKSGRTGVPFVSNKKTVCCHPDKVCGNGAYGTATCAYSGSSEDDCPEGTSFCKSVNGGILCVVDGKEECKNIKTDDDNTKGPVRIPSTCAAGTSPCIGQGDYQNVQCCAQEQSCTHDAGGFARCQGLPGEPPDPPLGQPYGDPPGIGGSEGITDENAINIADECEPQSEEPGV